MSTDYSAIAVALFLFCSAFAGLVGARMFGRRPAPVPTPVPGMAIQRAAAETETKTVDAARSRRDQESVDLQQIAKATDPNARRRSLSALGRKPPPIN